MTPTATFNRTAIMGHAWEIVRKANVAKFGLRMILSRALRAAWSEAKHLVAMARRDAHMAAPTPDIARTRDAITALECKDKLTQPDYARLGVMRAALRAKQEAAVDGQVHEYAA